MAFEPFDIVIDPTPFLGPNVPALTPYPFVVSEPSTCLWFGAGAAFLAWRRKYIRIKLDLFSS